MALRVAMIDGDEIVVRGLDSMFRSQGERARLVRLAPGDSTENQVDIALYDTFGAESDAAGVAALLADPRIDKVVLYTWNLQPWLAEATLALGVSGYLAKSLPARDLVEALVAIHAGEVVVAPDPDGEGPVAWQWPGRREGLAAREAEVLSLITMGLTNAEIAERTSLSLNTIKSYIRSVYRKIGVDSRSRAVLWGVAHGMRPDPVDMALLLGEGLQRRTSPQPAAHAEDPAVDAPLAPI